MQKIQASGTRAPCIPVRTLRLDSRIALVLTVGFSVLIWQSGPAGLAAFALGLAILAWWLRNQLPAGRAVFRAASLFVLCWGAVKCAVDLADGKTLCTAAMQAGLLSLRLALLLALGLSLSLICPARQLGLALAWYLRPLLGRGAWRIALAMALMLHYLPLVFFIAAQVRVTLRLRQVRGFWRRFGIGPAAVMRCLAGTTWSRTIALASRGLDCPEAWIADFPARPLAWLAAALALALGALAAHW